MLLRSIEGFILIPLKTVGTAQSQAVWELWLLGLSWEDLEPKISGNELKQSQVDILKKATLQAVLYFAICEKPEGWGHQDEVGLKQLGANMRV